MTQAIGAVDLYNMSIRDYRTYQTLPKFSPRDIVDLMHSDDGGGGIIGQEAACRAVATQIYSHFNSCEKPKRNILLIGPTGCGKSEIMRFVAKQWNARGFVRCFDPGSGPESRSSSCRSWTRRQEHAGQQRPSE